jgi:hypothetical protein
VERIKNQNVRSRQLYTNKFNFFISMNKNRLKLRNVFTIAICLAGTMMFSGCNIQPCTKVISATIEEGIATSGGITQIFQGYRPVRIEFIVYGFGKLPSVNEPTDYKAVSRWLVDYAHCYQNGIELERSYFYHYEDEGTVQNNCVLSGTRRWDL